jgi:hypothetical protein
VPKSKESRAAYHKKWKKENPDKAKSQWKKYYAENRESILERIKRDTKRMKDIIYGHYGGYKCSCKGCTFSDPNPAFYTLDHIENNGAEFRKSHSFKTGVSFYRWVIRNCFPTDLQVLCWNCNCAKNMNGGVCPHQEGKGTNG